MVYIYIDVGLKLAINLEDIFDNNNIILVDDLNISGGGIYNAFLAVGPKHLFIKEAIDTIVKNVSRFNYTSHRLELSGPIMLGKVRDKLNIKNINNVVLHWKTKNILFKNSILVYGKAKSTHNKYNELMSSIESDKHPKCSHYGFLWDNKYVFNAFVNWGNWNEKSKEIYIKKTSLYARLKNDENKYFQDYIDLPLDCSKLHLENVNGFFKSSIHYIPKNIFQTHKSLEYIETQPSLVEAMNSWKKWSSDFNYTFYDDNEMRKFIEEYCSQEILEAYDKLPIMVMKADLWRYCIIYHFAGIYADTDTICKTNPHIFIKNRALLVVTPEDNNEHFCQWIFASPAKSPILKTIIDTSVQRIKDTYNFNRDNITHYLTGPGVFSDGILNYLLENNLSYHSSKIFDQFNQISLRNTL